MTEFSDCNNEECISPFCQCDPCECTKENPCKCCIPNNYSEDE